MSSTTTATVVVPVNPASSTDVDEQAADHARGVFHDFEDHRFFYHDVQIDEHCEGDAVVALDSKAGEERVVKRMERTTKKRVNNLEEVLEAVEEEGTVEKAAQSRDLFSAAHRLGAYHYPEAGYLFDGCNWAYGSPILNREHLDKIIEHHDEDLYLVDLRLTY